MDASKRALSALSLAALTLVCGSTFAQYPIALDHRETLPTVRDIQIIGPQRAVFTQLTRNNRLALQRLDGDSTTPTYVSTLDLGQSLDHNYRSLIKPVRGDGALLSIKYGAPIFGGAMLPRGLLAHVETKGALGRRFTCVDAPIQTAEDTVCVSAGLNAREFSVFSIDPPTGASTVRVCEQACTVFAGNGTVPSALAGYWVTVQDEATSRLSFLRYVDNQMVERLDVPQPNFAYTSGRLSLADDFTLKLLLRDVRSAAVYTFSNTAPARLLSASTLSCSAGQNHPCNYTAGKDGAWFQFTDQFVERYQAQGVNPNAMAPQIYRRPLASQIPSDSDAQGQLFLRPSGATGIAQLLAPDGSIRADFPDALAGRFDELGNLLLLEQSSDALQARWLNTALQPLTAAEAVDTVLTNPRQIQARRLSDSEALVLTYHETGTVVLRVGSEGLRARAFVPNVALRFANHAEVGSYLYSFGDVNAAKQHILYRYDYLQQRLTEESICRENECIVTGAADIAGQSFVEINGDRVLQRISLSAPYREAAPELQNLSDLRAVTHAEGDVARFSRLGISMGRRTVFGVDAQGAVRPRYDLPSEQINQLELLPDGGAVDLDGTVLRADPRGELFNFPLCDASLGCRMTAARNGDVWRIVRSARGTEVQRFAAQGSVSAPLFIANRQLTLTASEDYLLGTCTDHCEGAFLIRESSPQTLSVFQGAPINVDFPLLNAAFGVLYQTVSYLPPDSEQAVHLLAFAPLPNEAVLLPDLFANGFE
jgi:hypothetical protein